MVKLKMLKIHFVETCPFCFQIEQESKIINNKLELLEDQKHSFAK